MPPTLPYRHLWSPDLLSRGDVVRLLDAAAALQQATLRPCGWQPLRGRRIALLCTSPGPAADAFGHAVSSAGGSVALLRGEAWTSPHAGLPDAARLLGRLYDAIDGGDVAPALIAEIDRHAGVPVFNGFARPDHPLRLLANLLTMREATGRPLAELRLRIAGDPAAPRARAAATLAQLAGVALQPLAAAGRDTHEPSPDEFDFEFDPSARPAAGQLTALHAPASEQARIAALLAAHQTCVLQALITSALG